MYMLHLIHKIGVADVCCLTLHLGVLQMMFSYIFELPYKCTAGQGQIAVASSAGPGGLPGVVTDSDLALVLDGNVSAYRVSVYRCGARGRLNLLPN